LLDFEQAAMEPAAEIASATRPRVLVDRWFAMAPVSSKKRATVK
jgi:hypothetical protein